MAIFTAERAKEQIIITKPTLTSAMRLALGV
jgi:leucyl aminopeptidase